MVVCPIVNIIQASKMTYLHSWVTCASYAVTSTSRLFQQRNVKLDQTIHAIVARLALDWKTRMAGG